MLDKVPTGIDFFDAEYGGIYRGRGMLLCGPAGSGKTVAALQFLAQGIKLADRCLLLSGESAHDMAIKAQSLGIPLAKAIESETLHLLEYSHFIPGRDQHANQLLPSEAFYELCEIVEREVIARVVIDTVVPWLALPAAEHLPEHVFSFVRAFERLGTSCLFTIPRPVSSLAVRLHRTLEDNLPISVLLNYEPGTGARHWLVKKYLGVAEPHLRNDVEIVIGQGIFDKRTGLPDAGPDQPPVHAPPAARPAPPAAGRKPSPASTGSGLANLILGDNEPGGI